MAECIATQRRDACPHVFIIQHEVPLPMYSTEELSALFKLPTPQRKSQILRAA
jgi:hypothetical protein